MSPEVIWLLNKAWVLLVGIGWHLKHSKDKEDKERDKTIRELERQHNSFNSKFITEAQMKEAIREALEPYKEDQQEIKLLLRGLNDHIFALSKDMAVQNAIRSLNDQQSNTGGQS